MSVCVCTVGCTWSRRCVSPQCPSASSGFWPPSLLHRILPLHLQGHSTQAGPRALELGSPRPAWPGLSGLREAQGGRLGRAPGSPGRRPGTGHSPGARSRPAPARRPRELTRPRVSAGIPAPALNMPVIFISLRQAARAIPPVAWRLLHNVSL